MVSRANRYRFDKRVGPRLFEEFPPPTTKNPWPTGPASVNSVNKHINVNTPRRPNPLLPRNVLIAFKTTAPKEYHAVDRHTANMPAPTAMLKPTEAPEALPLPAPEQEDELLIEMQDSDFANPSAMAPLETSDDAEMAIDVEGRPKFAPGKDVVRSSFRVGQGGLG
jgi:hypothetical protein